MVGLGDQKLIDEGKGKKAREASRRVEITVYTRQAAVSIRNRGKLAPFRSLDSVSCARVPALMAGTLSPEALTRALKRHI